MVFGVICVYTHVGRKLDTIIKLNELNELRRLNQENCGADLSKKAMP